MLDSGFTRIALRAASTVVVSPPLQLANAVTTHRVARAVSAANGARVVHVAGARAGFIVERFVTRT